MSFSNEYKDVYDLCSTEIGAISLIISDNIGDAGSLTNDIKNFIELPSKHVRSVLSILLLKAMEQKITDRILLFLGIVELIHNGSLVHDDIIDDSLERRGRSSLNAEYGSHLSVIAGDYILAQVLRLIAEIDSKDISLLVADTISTMCKGEISQYFSKYKIPSVEDYILKTYNKTGALFECAVKGSLLLSNCSDITAAFEFAKNYGIAFQIKNDIKNFYTNSSDSDLNNGIYTAPVIYAGAVENANSGIEKAYGLLDNYLCKAEEYLKTLSESVYRQSLVKLLGITRDE